MLIKFLKHYKQALKDVSYTLIPSVLNIIYGLLASILIARGLGVKGFGEYTLVMSIVTTIPALADLGIGTATIRFASRAANNNDLDSNKSILRWSFRIRVCLLTLICAIIFILSSFICSVLWHSPKLVLPLQLSLVISYFLSLTNIPTLYFQSLRDFKTNSLIQSIKIIINLLGIIVLAVLNMWTLYIVIWVSIISAFLSMFCYLNIVPIEIFFKKEDFKKPLINLFKISKEIAGDDIYSFTFYYIISTIIAIIALKMDIWIIGSLMKVEDVGIYNIAIRYSFPLTLIITAITTTLFPKASAITSNNDTVRLIKKTFKVNVLLAIGYAFYSIFIPLLTPMLYGKEYSSAIIISQLYCLIYCLNALSDPIWVISYNFKGMPKIIAILNLLFFLIAFITSVTLIPIFGLYGQLIALLLSRLSLIVIGGLFTIKKMNEPSNIMSEDLITSIS